MLWFKYETKIPKGKEVKKNEKEGIHAHRAIGRHSYHRHSGRNSLPSF